MNTNTKIAVLAGGTVIVGLAAYAIVKAMGNQTTGKILQIQASEGGTTNPAPSPSGISEPAGQVVTITATPNSGYTIGTWLLDGVEVGNGSSIQVTMDMNHSVIVTFWQGGIPPPSYPVAITSTGSVTAIGFYGCKIELGVANIISKISVHNCDQNWTWDNWAQYPMTFKVIDASGKGVPNIPVTLYPDLFPDNGNNAGLTGYLATNLYPHSSSDPLQLTTDVNGLVTFTLTYVYGLDDHLLKICQTAGLYVNALAVVIPITFTPYDGNQEHNASFFTGKGGEGVTGQRPEMGYFVLNSIHAKINGTSIQTQGSVYCGFHVKMF